MHKTGPSGELLGRLLGPLLKTCLPLMKNVLKPLAILIPIRLTAAKSATVEDIHKKIFGSDNKTLIIYHKEINDIMKIIKSFEESRLLIKEVRTKSKRTERRTSRNVIRHFRC